MGLRVETVLANSPASEAGITTNHFLFAVSDKANPSPSEWLLLDEETSLSSALNKMLEKTEKPFLDKFYGITTSANRDPTTFTVYFLSFVGLGEEKDINNYEIIPVTLTKRRGFVEEYEDQETLNNFLDNTYNNADD